MLSLKDENIIVLHENESGFVIKCKNCDEITISFGNIITRMTEEGFINLYQSMKNILKEIDLFIVQINETDKILVRTPAEHLIISFKIDEFHIIIELFDQAKLSLDIAKIIN
jgi:hypothetical protein